MHRAAPVPRRTRAPLARRAPRLRAPLGLLLSFLLAPPPAACAGAKEAEEPVVRPELETRLILRNASGKESTEFRSGEPITLAVTIGNRSGEARVLTLPSSQTHDCVVYAGRSEEIWRWSSGRMFAQMLTELTILPGESRTFTAAWDQIDAKGKPVPPGKYEAVGLVPARVPGNLSSPVAFTIRAPG